MRLTELLSPDRVAFFRKTGLQGSIAFDTPARDFDKSKALSALAAMLAASASIPLAEVERVLLEREALQSTGIGDGVGIPHGALMQLEQQWASLLVVPDGVEFDAIDGMKVTILFAVIGPKRATGEHLKTLARVSRLLRNKEFRERLVASETPLTAYELIANEEKEIR